MKVNWDDKMCSHSGECVKNLPNVFKVVNDKFVIDETGGSENEIKKVVSLCPSGALKIEE